MTGHRDSIEDKLELIAFWLELHGRSRGGSELFERVRNQLVPKAPKRARESDERTIRNWFTGHTQPSPQNILRLGNAIHAIALGQKREFDGRWLRLSLEELAGKIGIDPRRVMKHGVGSRVSDQAPLFRFDFAVPEDRMARMCEKYFGTYFIYRCASKQSGREIVRNVLRIGHSDRHLLRISLQESGFAGEGYIVPTGHFLCAHLVFGKSGDHLAAQSIYIRRNHRMQGMFVAVWVRATNTMAVAHRAVVLKKPSLDSIDWGAKSLTDLCRDFSPDTDIYKRLSPLLSRNSVVAESPDPNLTMERYEFMRALDDFDDGET